MTLQTYLLGKLSGLNPPITIKPSLYTRPFRAALFGEPDNLVDSTEKRCPRGLVHSTILVFRGYVRDDENLRETCLAIEVSTGQQQRVAVQIVEHVAML